MKCYHIKSSTVFTYNPLPHYLLNVRQGEKQIQGKPHQDEKLCVAFFGCYDHSIERTNIKNRLFNFMCNMNWQQPLQDVHFGEMLTQEKLQDQAEGLCNDLLLQFSVAHLL